VAAGLARHLGWPVKRVRWGFVAATLAMFAGPVLYVFLWVTLPREGATGPAAAQRFRGLSALRDLGASPARRYIQWGAAGFFLLGAAASMWAWRSGWKLTEQWWLPVIVLVAGLVVAWSQLGQEQTDSPSGRRRSILRLVAGLVLVTTGVILLLARGGGWGTLLYGLLAGLAVVAGVVVVLVPWWLRLWQDLGDERSARAREAERADIAAHLHDSVLQTLALLRSQADDADAVRRLARSQERELRAWLYEETNPPGTSVAAALRVIAAEVEDRFGVEIGVVVVGDAVPVPATEALLRAVREALLNAVRHGEAPFSVYLEVSERGTEAYVRDHGPGFDLASVPPDRFGVRESIIGRVERQGGRARVRRPADGGTEVELSVPHGTASDAGAAAPIGEEG
jgi:signal transduction histidine kinase